MKFTVTVAMIPNVQEVFILNLSFDHMNDS